MKRHLLPLVPLVTLLVSSAVWAQEVSNPQVPPPPPTEPVPSLAPGLPSPAQDAPPPGGPTVPPGTPSAPPPTTPCVPPPVAQQPSIFTAEALGLERTAGSCVPLGFTKGATVSRLLSDDAGFPLEAGMRLQVTSGTWPSGEGKNGKDDRTISEFTYWGLQQWSVSRAISGDPLGDATLVYSPWLQISALDNGFSGPLVYTDRTRVNNVELNDRVRLSPYSPDWNVNFLSGIRYFHLGDDFTLTGSDFEFDNSETRAFQTKNCMVGLQIGLQGLWSWGRAQVGVDSKIGMLDNFYTQHGTDTATGQAAIVPFDSAHSGSDWGALIEASAVFRYQLTKEIWLRAGYQYYRVTGLALGPRQLAGWNHNGVVGLDGVSLGVEGAW